MPGQYVPNKVEDNDGKDRPKSGGKRKSCVFSFRKLYLVIHVVPLAELSMRMDPIVSSIVLASVFLQCHSTSPHVDILSLSHIYCRKVQWSVFIREDIPRFSKDKMFWHFYLWRTMWQFISNFGKDKIYSVYSLTWKVWEEKGHSGGRRWILKPRAQKGCHPP